MTSWIFLFIRNFVHHSEGADISHLWLLCKDELVHFGKGCYFFTIGRISFCKFCENANHYELEPELISSFVSLSFAVSKTWKEQNKELGGKNHEKTYNQEKEILPPPRQSTAKAEYL